MRRILNKLDQLAVESPPLIRFYFGPAIWRVSVAIIWWLVMRFSFTKPSMAWLVAYSNHVDGVFQTLANVFGVLAAFATTSVTVIYAGSGGASQDLARRSPSSLPRKLIFAAITLLALGLLLAVLGVEVVDPKLKLAALGTAITLATIETATVAFATLRAIEGEPSSAEFGRDPD